MPLTNLGLSRLSQNRQNQQGAPRWVRLEEVDMDALSQIGTITREIVRHIVDRPEEVAVSEIEGTQATVLEVRVGKGDHGKLIGKQGRIANAIRELLVNYGSKAHRHYILEIID
jgi:uncharacterized protein